MTSPGRVASRVASHIAWRDKPARLSVVDEQAALAGHDDQLTEVERVSVRPLDQDLSGLGIELLCPDEGTRQDFGVGVAQCPERNPRGGREPGQPVSRFCAPYEKCHERYVVEPRGQLAEKR